MRPVDLRVEYAPDPTGVDVDRPRLSWALDAEGRGRAQTAYRVLVATSRDRLTPEDADRWDSGRVDTGRSTQVTYGGQQLAPGERVYWTVRVVDEDGTAGEWSEAGTWRAGRRGDWDAEWIASPASSNRERIRAHERGWEDYEVAATVAADGPFGLLARVRDADNAYAATVDPADGTVRVRCREHGQWQTLAEVDAAPDADGDYRLSVAVEGPEVAVALDGETVLTVADDTHEHGRPGFYAPAGTAAAVSAVAATAGDDRLHVDDFTDADPDDYAGGEVRDAALHLDGDGVVPVQVFRPYVAPGPAFRTDVALEGEVVDAEVSIAGLGFYELEVNGERVGDGVMDPGRTNYDGSVLYATHDVTDLVREGANAVGVELGRARYGAAPPCVVNWHRAPWWSDPELLFHLEVTYADGTTETVGSDGSWRVTDGPTRFDALLYGEVYDARRDPGAWTQPGFDDADWDAARVVDGPDGDLTGQQVRPVTVVDELDPVAVEEPEPGVTVYDFGRQVAGRVALTVDGARGDDVRVQAGEKRTDDGTVYARTPFRETEIQEDTYVLAGDGPETWAPRFTYHGFRYVQVEGAAAGDVTDLTAEAVHTPVEDGDDGGFDASVEQFGEVQRNCRRAYRNNLHSVPTDTPVYEKRGWTGDALLTAEAAMYNFDVARVDRKRLRDLRREVELDGGGFVPAVVPSADDEDEDPNLDRDPILGWQSEYPLLAWWLYRYYGDRRALEENYDALVEFLAFVEREAEDGLVVRTGLGDWLPPHADSAHPPEGPAIVGTAYYYEDTRTLAEMAEVLDRPDDAARFRELAASIRERFNAEFLDAEAGVYRTGGADEYRQTSNVMPLAFGLVPDEHEDRVVANLVENVRDVHDGHLATGVFGTKYLLEELSERGHHDVATAVASATTYPGWGFMLDHGATALWEAWDTDTRSLDHHFLGTVSEWFYQYVAGVREPPEPGFRTVRISPVPGDLDWAAASVDTLRGTVASRWERTGDGLALSVTVPPNTDAQVEVPALGAAAPVLREGDETVWDGGVADDLPPGVVSAARDGDRVVVSVGSGEYDFAVARGDESGGDP